MVKGSLQSKAAETIAEYAMNFGLSMPNDGKAVPTDEIADWLYNSLKKLRDAYAIADMPNDGDSEKWFTWIAHSNLISVRGDGYMVHFEEVFKEMFVPHTAFFEAEYGFSVQQFLDFCTHIEERIICKIGNFGCIHRIRQKLISLKHCLPGLVIMQHS